jgi:IS5 family transposase
MKLHIGVDSKTKLVHSAVATAANVHDSQVLDDLLHGEETRVWGDSAYAGQRAVLKEVAPRARDFTQCKASRRRTLSAQERGRNRTKSRVRSRVEHVFHVLKCRFGITKVRYRGPEKNANHRFAALALVNLVMAKRRLLQT